MFVSVKETVAKQLSKCIHMICNPLLDDQDLKRIQRSIIDEEQIIEITDKEKEFLKQFEVDINKVKFYFG